MLMVLFRKSAAPIAVSMMLLHGENTRQNYLGGDRRWGFYIVFLVAVFINRHPLNRR
ncbi:hypothetical protein [Pseudomonas petrae]|uniref:Uncharacterized protein n=1 Tax=Pseudomonas petrae TaxID=2912190 RepID=A0ABS9IA32_9PSED|nr:hypothetical protein [Pseudomonas petrae]MCF7535561.1 hypothetical protein [Pseudomonas petrae]MCF7540584.1 hypothetical protein [Pseudomonas petrae]MCF7544229.1 hypothetical protein [Pseudomonas petrae]MCF7558983.1 hypothetical protein [Pseudomonas petrae]